jgi:hypothetical protein
MLFEGVVDAEGATELDVEMVLDTEPATEALTDGVKTAVGGRF